MMKCRRTLQSNHCFRKRDARDRNLCRKLYKSENLPSWILELRYFLTSPPPPPFPLSVLLVFFQAIYLYCPTLFSRYGFPPRSLLGRDHAEVLITLCHKVVAVDVVHVTGPEEVELPIPIPRLTDTVRLTGHAGLGSRLIGRVRLPVDLRTGRQRRTPGSVDVFDPPTQLSAYGHKPWIIDGGELGHIHVVAADSDLDVAGESGRIVGHDLLGDIDVSLAFGPGWGSARLTIPTVGNGNSS